MKKIIPVFFVLFAPLLMALGSSNQVPPGQIWYNRTTGQTFYGSTPTGTITPYMTPTPNSTPYFAYKDTSGTQNTYSLSTGPVTVFFDPNNMFIFTGTPGSHTNGFYVYSNTPTCGQTIQIGNACSDFITIDESELELNENGFIGLIAGHGMLVQSDDGSPSTFGMGVTFTGAQAPGNISGAATVQAAQYQQTPGVPIVYSGYVTMSNPATPAIVSLTGVVSTSRALATQLGPLAAGTPQPTILLTKCTSGAVSIWGNTSSPTTASYCVFP